MLETAARSRTRALGGTSTRELAMSLATVEAFRARRPRDFLPVTLGYGTVDLLQPEQLVEAQVGYAVDPAGRSLLGQQDGAWLATWLVVATEDLVGDPIFVDTAAPEWPVYTAAHGEGTWAPELVADSFASFVAALDLIRSLVRNRETPVALERHPISPIERHQVLGEIGRLNPRSSLTFWQTWLEPL